MAVSGDDENQVAASLLRRAVISLIDDVKALAVAQVKLLDDEPEDAELMQQYGFTSNPPVGSEAIVIRIGGVPEHQIVISTAQRGKRPKVAEGEVKIYVADGPLIHITKTDIKLGDGATKGVNREGDNILRGAALATWMLNVETAVLPAVVPPLAGTSLGTTDTGSATVSAVD